MKKKILFLTFLFLTAFTLLPLSKSYSAVRQRPFEYKGYVPQSSFMILKHKANLSKFPPLPKKVIFPENSVKKTLSGIANLLRIKMPAKPVIKKYTAYGFNFNSYKIDKLVGQRLNYIKTLIHNHKNVISITGYTDSRGTKSYNDKLALKRALSVEKYLGLKNIRLFGFGKCCYISKRNFKDRRVVIKINK